MDILSHVVITFLISAILVGWIHPKIVQIAILKNIVDQPDARKLQRQPVPVLGGVAVFFGIVAGIGSMYDIVNTEVLMIVVLAMMAMLYTGTMDDILNLSPKLRFLIEIVVMLLLITYGGDIHNAIHPPIGSGRIPPPGPPPPPHGRQTPAIAEVRPQPPRRLALRAAGQSRREVNHVPVCPAAEAVEVVAVELQAWCPVRVERAAHEAMLNRPIAPRRLDGRDRAFYLSKIYHSHSSNASW